MENRVAWLPGKRQEVRQRRVKLGDFIVGSFGSSNISSKDSKAETSEVFPRLAELLNEKESVASFFALALNT